MQLNEDQLLFQKTCQATLNAPQMRNGIGTLGEKTVHAVFKDFYEPNKKYQEIPIGNFVADIFHDGEIIEIQTRNFSKLRKKLDAFLPNFHVTIIYPIVRTKYLKWIDENTGEISEKRKSPKKGTFYDAFFELYKIKSYLTDPHLHICLTLIDAEEYRLLNGWSKDRKKGSTRYDRIPMELIEEFYIGKPEDYRQLLPDNLPSPFSVKDYGKATGLATRYAGTAIQILRIVGVIKQTGKKGRAFLYERSSEKNI